MKKMINIALVATMSILFTACTSSSVPLVKSPSFKLGEQDGCKTATGEYAKNGDTFNKDKEYKDGWYAGRKNCNPAQTNKLVSILVYCFSRFIIRGIFQLLKPYKIYKFIRFFGDSSLRDFFY